MKLAQEARQFLRSTHSGMLATHSIKLSGYPYGSVAPFVLDHDGQPIILISTIAEHTKNIMADARVSLLVFGEADSTGEQDLLANARLTLVGNAMPTDKQDHVLKARYLRYFPQAVGYFDMHDFGFYRIQIAHARYIAGFGKMAWVSGDELSREALIQAADELAAQETGIIEHMNQDHADSMLSYCAHFHGVTAVSAEMLGIDSDGFDLKAGLADGRHRVLRFNFEQPIHDAMSARSALVSLSKAART